jgi:subtilisin family serine protease
MATQSFSLHIGLNQVDKQHYQGWDGALFCCENDALFFHSVAKKAGFTKSQLLITSDPNNLPTSNNLSQFLAQSSTELAAGDSLFITYSGHGGVMQDLNFDEDDFQDETWCLYDRQFLDDELFEHFSLFKKGVRIFIISDSCHSGSVVKVVATDKDKKVLSELDEIYVKLNLVTRNAPREKIFPTYMANKDLYDPLMKKPVVRPDMINASVLLFGACQDDEKAAEWDGFGLFTSTIKKVLETSKDISTYRDLFTRVKHEMPGIQHPNLFSYGENHELFVMEKPFQVNGATGAFSFFDPARNTVEPLVPEEQLIIEMAGNQVLPGSLKEGYRTAMASRSGDESSSMAQYYLKSAGATEKNFAWDNAYNEYFKLKDSGVNVAFVEPDIKNKYLKETPVSKKSVDNANNYMSNWPKPAENLGPAEFIWHLDHLHSQLFTARETVLKAQSAWTPADKEKYNPVVRIGHIDTGYVPDHPSLPKFLLRELGISFVNGENNNKAIDQLKSGTLFEQDGHGCATMALLAGNYISEENSYASFAGEFGGMPFAEVLPIRICDTVVNLFNANDMASGIDYAVDNGCEVITMSMAGYPTRRVAKAVNRAYEKGVVIVTAAGNNWKGGVMSLTPKAVMYPARFERVIAACGVCYNEEPYDQEANGWLRFRSEGGENMQGNFGPEKAMTSALAGYTPNLAWAANNQKYKFSKAGGGTSSATPQIAAAAALWIAFNRKSLKDKGYTGTWKQAEAVRQALFAAGGKTYPGFKKYYGNGSLKANDALNISGQILETEFEKAKEAKVSFLGLSDFVGTWSRGLGSDDPAGSNAKNADEILKEMLSLEIGQILYKDPELFAYTEMLDFDEEDTFLKNPAARDVFINKIKLSKYASDTLKAFL